LTGVGFKDAVKGVDADASMALAGGSCDNGAEAGQSTSVELQTPQSCRVSRGWEQVKAGQQLATAEEAEAHSRSAYLSSSRHSHEVGRDSTSRHSPPQTFRHEVLAKAPPRDSAR
jgi:hypothetical protein